MVVAASLLELWRAELYSKGVAVEVTGIQISTDWYTMCQSFVFLGTFCTVPGYSTLMALYGNHVIKSLLHKVTVADTYGTILCSEMGYNNYTPLTGANQMLCTQRGRDESAPMPDPYCHRALSMSSGWMIQYKQL